MVLDGKMKALLTALFLSTCAAAPAVAQQECAPHSVVNRINAQNGMVIVATGVSGVEQIDVYANPMTGQWVIVARYRRGLTCLVASGIHFEGYNWGFDT